MMLTQSLLTSVLVTGLVTIMMIMIECVNIRSRGNFLSSMASNRFGGILTGAMLGIIPGCMGGFAAVSLYTHGMLSFGALVAMMIASSGDEAFVMLAMVPDKALMISGILFSVALMAGIVSDLIFRKPDKMRCTAHYEVHSEDKERHLHEKRHFGWKRTVMFIGVAAFITALVTGVLEEEEEEVSSAGFSLLSEEWMNWLFAGLSLLVLAVTALAPDHFIEEHLWSHIVVKHMPGIFAWTFGVLLVMDILLAHFDISSWISGNTALMIVLATLIGIIPESGPHLIFVTLYAGGIIPLPVLLASCISQDGHASLPLIAESKLSFLKAKAVNCAFALAAGFTAMIFI